MTGFLSDMKGLYIVDKDQKAMVPWLPLSPVGNHQHKGGSHEVYLESNNHRDSGGDRYSCSIAVYTRWKRACRRLSCSLAGLLGNR
jgi:hypothetical protein